MTQIWGHRGACAYAPENTIPSFKLALDMGADGLELDIHLSKDGRLIVSHDGNLTRCGGCDVNINDALFDDLKKADVSHKFSDKYPGARLPELCEVFALMKDYPGTVLNIEMKDADDEFVRVTDIECRKSGMLDRIVFSCFNLETLLKLRKLMPDARLALLYGNIENAIEIGTENHLWALHPNESWALIEGNIKKAQEAGLVVNPWTVNSAENMASLISFGADALITNVPDTAIKVRSSK